MAVDRFLVLNGPNLAHIGLRQTEIYGLKTMQDLETILASRYGQPLPFELSFAQSNSEGGLIDRLEKARQEGTTGIALNAGAYTHTSLALADCLAWIGIPCVEVHLSNILARSEPMRHQSLIARHCLGVVAGFGVIGYALALQALLDHAQTSGERSRSSP